MFVPHDISNLNSSEFNMNLSQEINLEKFNLSYFLETQPDFTFRIKFRKSKQEKKIQGENKFPSFSEFYDIVYIPVELIELKYIDLNDFDEIISFKNQIKIFLKHLKFYDKYFYSYITNKEKEFTNVSK